MAKNMRCAVFLFAVCVVSVLATGYTKVPKNYPSKTGGFAIPETPEKLTPLRYHTLKLGSVKPLGWLLDVLTIQSHGLTGHLDEIWMDVSQSGWIGGNAEGWERGPYWLRGVLPLAYLLDSTYLKNKVEHWCTYIMKHQQPDGMLGPVDPRGNLGIGHIDANDTWPASLALDALTQYYDATGDGDVLVAMEKYFVFLDELLDKNELSWWGKYRWQDLSLAIAWMYDHTQDESLLKLGWKVASQGFDWAHHYENFTCKARWTEDDCADTQAAHGVNIAQALKTAPVFSRFSNKRSDGEAIHKWIALLDKYHGVPGGMFNADELLAGANPSQGAETCAVTEYIFSMTSAVPILGDVSLVDRLESIAFNAMPASQTPNWWSHPYIHQANQVASILAPDEPIYVSDGPEANQYGLDPNYGCCTANLHQGLPKFTAYGTWLRNETALVAAAYAPTHVKTAFNDVDVEVTLETDYPFNGLLNFTVTTQDTTSFHLCLRIPVWATGSSLWLEGKKTSPTAGDYYCVPVDWNGSRTLQLDLNMQPQLSHWYHNSVAITRGPLVFSMPIGEEWTAESEQELLWECRNTTAWNYALEIDTKKPLSEQIHFEFKGIKTNPFDPAEFPVVGSVQARLVPEWGFSYKKSAADHLPKSPLQSLNTQSEAIPLAPFGSTRLRVSAFPWVDVATEV